MTDSKRAQLEIKISRYRRLAQNIANDPKTVQSIEELITELERQLRKLDEQH